MEFFHDLYTGERIAPNIDQTMKKVNSGNIVPELYLITLSEHPDHMLEIIPQWELTQTSYPKRSLRVVGLAKGKKEAFGLVQYMIEVSLEQTGSADVRNYLRQRWEEVS